ncbi:MAG TPA: polysaccharide deacetylase family protein [Flavobacteriales bacterium]
MRPLLHCALLLCALVGRAQEKRVVITIDDLPCAGCPEGTWKLVTEDLLRTLTRHDVPAVGFVNEGKLYRDGVLDSARYRLLERWLEAGLDLGNHTFAHLGATRHSLAEYEQDIVQGEQHLRPLMERHGKALRYFRHPFLQTGPTVGYRDSLNAVIARHGYTIAPVTFDNDEYIFAHCYAHAASDSSRARSAEQYHGHMRQLVHFHEAQAQAFLGHPIPQILLIHANLLNAAELDGLLQWFRAEGYRFIPLEEALKDPCYTLPQSVTRYGFSWIRRWQEAAGQRPPWPPEIPTEVQERYDTLQQQ